MSIFNDTTTFINNNINLNGYGLITSAGTLFNTILGYLYEVTSPIQNQFSDINTTLISVTNKLTYFDKTTENINQWSSRTYFNENVFLETNGWF